MKNMRDILLEVFGKEGNCEEAGVLSEENIQDIIDFDPHPDYIEELENYMFPMELNIHKKPDFSELEDEFNIKMNENIKEYFSIWWQDDIQIRSDKAVTKNHSDIHMWLSFLKCPADIYNLRTHCRNINSVIEKDLGDFYIPIGWKMDGWSIVVNNKDEAVYILEHDPEGLIKRANSITEFLLD